MHHLNNLYILLKVIFAVTFPTFYISYLISSQNYELLTYPFRYTLFQHQDPHKADEMVNCLASLMVPNTISLIIHSYSFSIFRVPCTQPIAIIQQPPTKRLKLRTYTNFTFSWIEVVLFKFERKESITTEILLFRSFTKNCEGNRNLTLPDHFFRNHISVFSMQFEGEENRRLKSVCMKHLEI